MGAHKNEHILKENEGVVDGQGQQDSCEQASKEEVCRVANTGTRGLVNLGDHCVKTLLCFLDFENLEAAEDRCDQEEGSPNVDEQKHVG